MVLVLAALLAADLLIRLRMRRVPRLRERWADVEVLVLTYALGVAFRLIPRLSQDPHLLTFEADIWYRLAMGQYVLDHGRLPVWDLRYEAYGFVPTWYNPIPPHFFAGLARLFQLDLPTVSSRILPWIEALTPLPFYLTIRALYSRRLAIISTVFLSLTPSFVFWSGISDPQSVTLFVIPIAILLWIRYLEGQYLLGRPFSHLCLMGILFALNFLTHLTFFLMVLIVASVHIGLVLEGRTTMRRLGAFLVPVVISQMLTAWWWLPSNLYWWWTQALTTSSALYEGRAFLKQFGAVAAAVGHLAFLGLVGLVVAKRKGFPALWLLPLAWAFFPMIESHNEGILHLFKRRDLSWWTLVKPLEGFRFYCFLAQPLSLCVGIVAEYVWRHAPTGVGRALRKRALAAAAATGLVVLLVRDFNATGYNIGGKLRNAGITLEEYAAALWYRNHSQPSDRLMTEYYTAQMVIGVVGGRTLEGSMFSLRNVAIPYISEGWRVQKDIYEAYTTEDPLVVKALMRRYGCTHIAWSPKILTHIEHITKGDSVLDDIPGLAEKDYSKTLFDPEQFEEVYRQGDVRLLKTIK